MILNEVYSSEKFRKSGHELIELLSDYLKGIEEGKTDKTIRWTQPEEEYGFWKRFKSQDSHVFFSTILERSIQIHRPGYMGHQVAVPAPISALASMLSGFLNNGMAVYEMGAASSALERIVIEIIGKALGFEEHKSSGFLTSGGTLANLTALLAARAKHFPGMWIEGHQNKKLAILVSEQAHYCIDRAARIMGVGSEGIVQIPVDEKFKVRIELVEGLIDKKKKEGCEILAVVGSACTTATGSYDDLTALAKITSKLGIWLHVDGAHGAAVCFSNKYKYLIEGIHLADSVTIDCHKMMMTSSVTTALVFKDGKDSFRTFNQKAEYLWSEAKSEEWFNYGKRTFECTKLMMSIQFYSIIQLYGIEAIEAYVEKVQDNAQLFYKFLKAQKDFEVLLQPESNIVCFRYCPKSVSLDGLNELNASIRQTLLEAGIYYIVQSTINGQKYLRTTLMNPFSTSKEFESLIENIRMICL